MALESLHESLSLMESAYWIKLRVQIMIKICDCYWNMNMNREFLIKFFDYIQNFNQIGIYPSNHCEKLSQSAKRLDDVLQIEFSNFFEIESISEPEIMRDDLVITLNLSQLVPIVIVNIYAFFKDKFNSF